MKIEPNKTHSIHLRLTDEQYEYCFGNAELMGVGVSEFLRMVVNSLLVSSNKVKEIQVSNMLGDLKNANNKNNI